MQNLINETAALIAAYNPQLAAAFIAQPFRRVDLARSFAVGFVQDVEDDVHPVAAAVLRVAYADRDARRLVNS